MRVVGPLDVPVVLVVFNRPETTRAVMEAVRRARPARLFVVADGPRADRPGEAARCEAALAEATRVDWPCDVAVNRAERNMGCRFRLPSGLDWVFSQVEEAIVLEDDCVPSDSFFGYCRELLERYRDDPRVMCVSGDSFDERPLPGGASYRFSWFAHIWGWATWRRAWAHNDVHLREWPRLRRERFLYRLFGRPSPAFYFERKLDAVARGALSSWAFPWQLACWRVGGLTALPARNLVSNVGFGPDATHTRGASSLGSLTARELALPLRFPTEVFRDAVADARSEGRVFLRRPVLRLAAAVLDGLSSLQPEVSPGAGAVRSALECLRR